MRTFWLTLVTLLPASAPAWAQGPPACRLLCGPGFSVEPTVSIGNLFGAPRVVPAGGEADRERRTAGFELILSLGLPTRLPWLEFTVEAILLPFERDATPELEFETNLTWLPASRTRGWLSSHFDIVDKFSPAERPTDRRAYTHKVNFELDTSLAVFNWLPRDRWLRQVELEASLDYVATGLPRAGDVVGGVTFLDHASPWSVSIVLVVPVAPF